MIRFEFLGGRVQEFSLERHRHHFLEKARRFHALHQGKIISKQIIMTPAEIITALEAVIAAVQALPTTTTPQTPTEVDVKEPDGTEETFVPEAPAPATETPAAPAI